MDRPRIADANLGLRHVFLRDMVLSASIGIYAHEHATPQRIRINVDLGVTDDGALPMSRAAKLAARGNSAAIPPVMAALTDGEDFELLFTVASNDAVKLLDAWRAVFPKLKLSCIGKIVAGSGIVLRDRHGSHPFNAGGYEHFG